jgi:hypothetical protein
MPIFTTFYVIFPRRCSARVTQRPIFVFRTSQSSHNIRIGHIYQVLVAEYGSWGGPFYVNWCLVARGTRTSARGDQPTKGTPELRSVKARARQLELTCRLPAHPTPEFLNSKAGELLHESFCRRAPQ